MIAAVVAAERLLPDGPAPTISPAALDAVTLDAYGTLLQLRDPVGHLDRELRARGVELAREAVERGFRGEVECYLGGRLSARDGPSLAELRVRCAQAFLRHAGAALDPAEFAPALEYEYEVLPGVREALRRLTAHGLALAVVANWDVSLHEQLRRQGLADAFAAVVTAAEVGAAKPDPAPFLAALGRLGVASGRALHVGDREDDRAGAEAAGLRFLPAPLPAALEGLL